MTAYHPQTEGQTERVNTVAQKYLQDEWEDWLAQAEFAENNAASETMKMLPFFLNYDFDPHFSTYLILPRCDEDQNGRTLAQALKVKHVAAGNDILKTQDKQRDGTDHSRLPAPHFQIGQTVLLDVLNIKTQQLLRKLDNKRLEQFPILGKVETHVYRLQQSEKMKIHLVLHISLLELAAKIPMGRQVIPPPPPVSVDGEEKYTVNNIINSRMNCCQHE